MEFITVGGTGDYKVYIGNTKFACGYVYRITRSIDQKVVLDDFTNCEESGLRRYAHIIKFFEEMERKGIV